MTAPPPPKKTMPFMRPPREEGVRVVLVAPEGMGKTSIGAHAERPMFICMPDEKGYDTLRKYGLIPESPAMHPRNWIELLQSIEYAAEGDHGRKTLVIDAAIGVERMLIQHIIHKHCEGDPTKFDAYGRGTKFLSIEWPAIFGELNAAAARGMDVLILSHAKAAKYSPPDGSAYDRYTSNILYVELWAALKAWAQAVLFYTTRAIVDTARPETNVAKAKGKAIAGERILRCTLTPVAEAKNQWGLDPEYTMPDDPKEAADIFWNLTKPRSK